MFFLKLIGIFVWIKLSVEFLLSGGCDPEGKQGYFQYTVKNIIHKPTFTHSVNMSLIGCGTNMSVTKYMEHISDQHKQLFPNFSETYYPGVGFYVTALNGLEEIQGETYWEFIEHVNGKQFPVAASNYAPKHGDHIGWNLTEINQ